jgi:hypothetical protein
MAVTSVIRGNGKMIRAKNGMAMTDEASSPHWS